MMKTSTLPDLLSYAYNETGLCDSDRIQRSIDGDPLLESEYKILTETISLLSEAKPEINPASVKRILDFARA